MSRSWLLLILVYLHCGAAWADESAKLEFFEKRIRPALIKHCYECHSAAADEPGGGLRLDSRPAIRKGGESGPAIVPGDVGASLLIDAVNHRELEMPPEKKLDAETIAALTTWVNDGAVDPRDRAADAKTLAKLIWEDAYRTRKRWWSFQPVAGVEPPRLQASGEAKLWLNSPIDRFLLRALQKRNLAPATTADRETLIRRLAFTLTGLPPRREAVAAFVEDQSENAWERLVEKYLASEHFGERFARHWMDVVRYADTYGYEWDVPAKGAWRYRDYLIRAFNADVPFDQLVREQLAGDLLAHPRINESLQLNESAIGPMFYQLGEHRHGDSLEFEGIHQEMLDNKVDAFSKAFQAITIACARCHDHKLDPVTQKEYYALAGVFMSSRWVSTTVDLPERNAETLSQLKSLKADLRDAIAAVWMDDLSSNITAATLDAIQPDKPLPVGDINHPWNAIYKTDEGEALSAKWSELQGQLTKLDADAKAFNEANFTLLADFSKGVPADWGADGRGLRVVASGDFRLAPGEVFVESLFLPGVATANLSSKLNGALRSPLLQTIDAPFVSIQAAGGDYSAFRRVIDNAFLCEKQTYYANPRYQWKVESTFAAQKQRRIFFEFATKTSNPNFPPRWGLGAKLTDEVMRDPRSWFAVSKIYKHKQGAPPKRRLTAFLSLLASGRPSTKAEAAELYRDWLVAMVKAWRDGRASAEQIQVLNNLLQTPWVSKSASHAKLKPLIDQYRRLELKVQSPRTVNSLADQDEGVNYRLNVRGSYYDLGDEVPRGYLRLLAKQGASSLPFEAKGSGRLRLAELVASETNPLTARVYVNRVWQWLFGEGIVDTPSNFGKLGGLPSHAELLDWLAADFVADGWSTKRLVRRILLTQAWRQSSAVSTSAVTVDPRNRLLHHFPTRRLEAECIGDAMLVVSGKLDARLYGEPHDPFRTAEDEMKRLFAGPVDGNGRRMLYTKVTIMEPAKFLTSFNLPEPKIPTGKRDVTNTPNQALTLLNHPFVLDAAAHWGERAAADGRVSPKTRLKAMLANAFSRSIGDEELRQWEQSLGELADLRKTPRKEIMSDAAIWSDIAHMIFNSKEFIYVR